MLKSDSERANILRHRHPAPFRHEKLRIAGISAPGSDVPKAVGVVFLAVQQHLDVPGCIVAYGALCCNAAPVLELKGVVLPANMLEKVSQLLA